MIPFRLERDLQVFVDLLCSNEFQTLDLASAKHAEKVLGSLLKSTVKQILDREGLPHIAHLICGWGDSIAFGRRLPLYISDFIFDCRLRPRIQQSREDGDFHPWQSFAYCRMANLPQSYAIGNVLLRTLMRNSTDLNTSDPTDLGHLLYCVAHDDLDNLPRFIFGGDELNVSGLVEQAVEGHVYGGYHVCRKFHLTEGLCAISARSQFFDYHEIVSELLYGQLQSLRPLLAITCLNIPAYPEWRYELKRLSIASDTLARLRERLVVGDSVEKLDY